MTPAACLKQVGHSAGATRDLCSEDAARLFGAMLDSGIPDLELGALLVALGLKGESASELLGFHAALDERIVQMRAPDARPRTVVIPAYNETPLQADLMPLLALLLKRLGVPVLVHGMLESEGRVGAAYVLRELGVMPSAGYLQAEEALAREGIAFVPIGALAPGLSNLLALKSRLGLRNSAHTLAKLVDPFSAAGAGLRLIATRNPRQAAAMREFLAESAGTALLMQDSEDEAPAARRVRSQIEYFAGGAAQVLFQAQTGYARAPGPPGHNGDARSAAAWIRAALDGEHPIPTPLIIELACCLYASGFCADFAQAKAVAAVRARVPQPA